MSHTSTPKHHALAHKSTRRATRKSGTPLGHTAPALPRARQADPRNNGGRPQGMASVLLSALFALLPVIGISLLLLFVMTAIVLWAADPDAMLAPMAMAGLGVSSLIGGIIAARRCGGHSLLCGLCTGLLLTFLLWILTLFIDRTDPTMTLGVSTWGQMALHAVVVALAGAGGMIGGGARRAK